MSTKVVGAKKGKKEKKHVAHGIAHWHAYGEKVVAVRIRLERHRRFHWRTGETFHILGRDRAPAVDVLVDGA